LHAFQVVGQLPGLERLIGNGVDVVLDTADQVILVRFDGVRDRLAIGRHVVIGAQVTKVSDDGERRRRVGAESGRPADQMGDARVFRVFVPRPSQESHRHPTDLGRVIGNGHHQRVVWQFFCLHLRTSDAQRRRFAGVTAFRDAVHHGRLQR